MIVAVIRVAVIAPRDELSAYTSRGAMTATLAKQALGLGAALH
jgi:hypothetical protein